MTFNRKWLVVICVLASSCVASQPADPDTVQKIMQVCEYTGFFEFIGGAASLAVPYAALPIKIIDAGIDKVCMSPEKFASDISTVQWLIQNLSELSGRGG